MIRSAFPLYIAAAITTAIGGILHLMLGPNSLGFNPNNGIFFIVGGIAQVFWIIPMIRQWGKLWYSIGIAGTIVLIAVYFITRMPGNPITGRGGQINSMAIAVEAFQIAFVALAVAILIYEIRQASIRRPASNKRKSLILVGIVVAIVLGGLFVPMAMGGPMGQRPGQPGPPSGQPAPQEQTQPTGTATKIKCTLTPSLIEVEGTPQQTEGPYFVDEKLDRTDIRSDPSDGTIQEGVPLSLVIKVFNVVGNDSCVPLDVAQVDVWHADSQGLYSDVAQIGTLGKKYLRGYQITNESGAVQFTTVYPGWYEGRAIHIHIKVRTFEQSEKTFEWTSQLYLDNSVNNLVHTISPYSNHGTPQVANEQDGIFAGPSTDGLIQNDTGNHLMLHLLKTDDGYLGTFNVVVDAGKS